MGEIKPSAFSAAAGWSPVSLCPPDSRLPSAFLLHGVACLCLGVEPALVGEASLSLESPPGPDLLPWIFSLGWEPGPASLAEPRGP